MIMKSFVMKAMMDKETVNTMKNMMENMRMYIMLEGAIKEDHQGAHTIEDIHLEDHGGQDLEVEIILEIFINSREVITEVALNLNLSVGTDSSEIIR